MLAFGRACASLCEALGGEITGHAVTSQLKTFSFANIGVCSGVDGGMRMIDSAEYLSLPQGAAARFRSVRARPSPLTTERARARASSSSRRRTTSRPARSSATSDGTCCIWPNYNCESFIEQTVRKIRAAVGDGRGGLRAQRRRGFHHGGVPGAARGGRPAALPGDRQGLEPDGEVERIRSLIGKGLGLEIRQINAGRMMDQLQGCVTPGIKRKAVAQFISDRIADEAARLGGRVTVIRATNYPDVLEGHASSAPAGDIPLRSRCAVQGRGARGGGGAFPCRRRSASGSTTPRALRCAAWARSMRRSSPFCARADAICRRRWRNPV